jgi:hypothetical protein
VPIFDHSYSLNLHDFSYHLIFSMGEKRQKK